MGHAWVQRSGEEQTAPKKMKPEQFKQFQDEGFTILHGFATDEEVEAMRQECHQLVHDMDPTQHQTVFSTTKLGHANNYFLQSGDRIGYFFEDGALNEKGELQVDKHESLNKIGHAMHQLCPSFRKFTFSAKVKDVARIMNFKDPIICQSMYIFKQPNIGGKVVPHQDATYLLCDTNVEAGIWVALEDATEENGCLYFIPGSQKGGLYGDYRMVRTEGNGHDAKCGYLGDKPDYNAIGKWVAAPVKKGDAILIDGYVVHKSETNTSNKSRHIYTFHMFDQARGKWNSRNWLQPTERGNFMQLFDE